MTSEDTPVEWMFYDKCTVNGTNVQHGFTNPLVKNFTISDIMKLKGETVRGLNAIHKFNELFKLNQPFNDKINLSLYKIRLIIYQNDNVKYIFTLIGVNISNIVAIKNISDTDLKFLAQLWTFHNYYVNGIVANHSSIKEVVDKIMSKDIDPNDPCVSDKDIKFVKIELFNYQKKTIKWMLDRELKSQSIPNVQCTDVILNSLVFNISTKILNKLEDVPKITIKGGSLIDEMGLGKTIQTITTSILNPRKNLSYIQDGRIISKATLILCPNHLCGQWVREFKEMIKSKYLPIVKPFLTKVHYDKYTYQDILDADFVVMPYNFLDNKVFLNSWMSNMNVDIKKYHKLTTFNVKKAKEVLDELRDKLIKDPLSMLALKNPNILLIDWQRIIIDEFHEIYSISKYLHMTNLIKLLNSEYRWCVTGTPFTKNMECLIHMVDFLSNYTIQKNKITINDHIMKLISTSCFRRNTKIGVSDELVLPPVEEEVVWLKFTPIERIMYNAYLQDNKDEYSVYLRQLCCHPNIANETKTSLIQCKTLEEIEKTMLKYYEDEMIKAVTSVKTIETSIKRCIYEIARLSYRRIKYYIKKDKDNDNDKNKDNDKDNDKDKDEDEENPSIPLDDEGYDTDEFSNIDDEYDVTTLDKPTEKDLLLCAQKAQLNVKLLKNKTYDDIYKTIINKLKINETMWWYNLHEAKDKFDNKKLDATEKYKSKKQAYDFYKNAIEKVKKIMPTDGNINPLDTITNQGHEQGTSNEDVCSICLGEIEEHEICITKCGHIFCFSCINLIVSKQGTCPYCKTKLVSTDLSIISYARKKDKENDKDKKIGKKSKDDLINELGTKLANLIFYIREHNVHTIIFSQWDDILHKIGKLLTGNDIPNIFCTGNTYQKDKAIREFSTNDKIKVIMLSTDSAASGTNLTKAKQILLLDPVYGTAQHKKNIEGQAIGRAHRLGQTDPVKVVRFIIKDTVEEKIYLQNIVDSDHDPNNIPNEVKNV